MLEAFVAAAGGSDARIAVLFNRPPRGCQVVAAIRALTSLGAANHLLRRKSRTQA